MPTETENKDWAALVGAIVQRTPNSAPEPASLKAQVRLLALLGTSAPLHVLLDGLAKYVETWTDGVLCSVMLVDPSGKRLLPSAAPSLPAAYVSAVGSVLIADGQGSCGTAAARRAMVVVEDIGKSPLWARSGAVAMSHGLYACWSVPMVDDADGLLGTLALYYGERRSPTRSELDLVEFAAYVAAFAIRRHRDSERVRASEQRLGAAVWGTDVGLWESSPAEGCRWVTQWTERFGIDPCFGRDVTDEWRARMHPEDILRYERATGACDQRGVEHYSAEYRVRDTSERWCWVHERGRVTVRAHDGTPTHCVGVCIDVNEHKLTEAALREAESRYELATNAARLPVWEYDVARDSVQGNVYWHRTVGYDLSETAAHDRRETWISDIHPDDIPGHQFIFDGPHADATGFYESEFRVRLPSGQYKWLLDRARVVERDAADRALKVVGVSIDIDARKRLEGALREGEQRLANALWGAQAAYWSTNLADNTTCMSESFFSMTGIDRAAWEMDVGPWCTWVHPEDAPMGCARYQAHLEGRTDAFEHEYRIRTPSGWRWIQDRGRIVERDPSGRPLRISGTSVDVSARKSVERDTVEAIGREQRRISYDLHDGLGQRLTGIALLLDAATSRIRKQTPMAADDLELISAHVRETIGATQALVRGLLPASVQNGDVVLALRSLAEQVSTAYGLVVDFKCEGLGSVRLAAETTLHIYRIAQETLNNARRHGRAANVRVSISAPGGALSLDIVDDGIGIPALMPESAGSGLKIMDYRAQILGGTISVQPCPSGGTQMALRCPIDAAAASARRSSPTNGRCQCVGVRRQVETLVRPIVSRR